MAAPLRIVFDDWFTESRRVGLTRIPQFMVFRDRDTEHVYVAGVELRASFAERLLDGRYREDAERTRLEEALLRFAVRRIERALATGALPTEPTSDIQELTVEEEDLPELARLLDERTCDYQVHQGRDLFCSAASPGDKTIVATEGHRRLAPTSRAICSRCGLPDTDAICSHLVHPRITALRPVAVAWERFVEEALCERARPERDRQH
jgi:hypothetical protein